MFRLMLTALAFVLTAFQYRTEAPCWSPLPGYEIKFDGTGATGTFSNLSGSICFDGANPQNGSIDVTVDAASIKTGNSVKDKHARSDDWLHAAKYKTIRIKSTSFSKSAGNYVMQAQLTLHGVTRNISIPFSFENKNGVPLFTGTFSVNRKDYGIEGPLMSFTVGDRFDISIQVPVAPKTQGRVNSLMPNAPAHTTGVMPGR